MRQRKPFVFREFAIEQAQAAMPVTTDACIFGALVQFENRGEILDLGTGTGLLTLMLAQRFDNLKFTALEIQEESCFTAEVNFKASPWYDRISLICGDAMNYQPGRKFDGIICNPPFYENQLKSSAAEKRIARHTDQLSYSNLLNLCKDWLAEQGVAHFLLPELHSELFLSLAEHVGFYSLIMNRIRSFPDSESHVVTVSLVKNNSERTGDIFTIYQKTGVYTEAMKKLMAPYYL